MAITNFRTTVDLKGERERGREGERERGREGERENFKLKTDQNRPDLEIAIHNAAKIFRLE
jgi:hypothetical protein